MEGKKAELDRAAEIRVQAEERLRQRMGTGLSFGAMDASTAPHDLQVYLIELEIQNEELRKAQRQLEENRQQYDDFCNLALVGCLRIDGNGLIEEANSATTTLLGVGRSRMLQQPVTDFIAPEDQDVYDLHRKQLYETKSKQESDIRMKGEGGRVFWANIASLLQEGAEARTVHLVTITDITERKRVQESLRDNELQLKLFVEYSPAAIAMFNTEMKYIIASRRWYDDYNLGAQEIIGRSHYDIFPEISERWKAIHRRCLCGAIERCEEDPFRRSDGRTDWIRWEIHPWRNVRNEIGGIIIFTEVITARKQIGEALRESEDRFRSLYENSTIGLYRTAPDGTILLANPALVKMLGYTSFEELAARNLEQEGFEPSYERKKFIEHIEREGELRALESAWTRRDGSMIHVRESARAIRANGKTLYYDGTVEDISERKQAEGLLRRLQSLLVETEAIGKVGGWEIDIDTMAQIWTEEIYHIHEVDLSYEPTVDKGINFYTPASRAVIERAVRGAIERGEPFDEELEIITAKNRFRWVHAIGRADLEHHRVIGFLQDITERKRSEAVKNASLRLSSYALTHSLDELLAKTLDEAEALTSSTIGFFHFLAEDQKTLSLQMWSTNTLATMCTAEGKGQHYSIDVAGVWVDCVHERRPVIHNDYASLPHRKGMPAGHAPVQRELLVPMMRGEVIVGILGIGNKPYDYDDQDVEAVSLLANLSWDIIVGKRAEEKIKHLLEEKEIILREVHHRIKNNMNTMMSLLSLQAGVTKSANAAAALTAASHRMRSMLVLYEKLYRSQNFGDIPMKDYLSQLVNEIIHNISQQCEVTIRTSIQEFPLDAKNVSALGIIINELLSNIAKYAFVGRASGTIAVCASKTEKHVLVTVEDDGVGIPESVEIGSSTGFGLQLVDMLTKQIGGSIRMERGHGTKFVLQFET